MGGSIVDLACIITHSFWLYFLGLYFLAGDAVLLDMDYLATMSNIVATIPVESSPEHMTSPQYRPLH